MVFESSRDELDRRDQGRRAYSRARPSVGSRPQHVRAEHASMWGERISDRAGRPSRPDHWAASFRVAARQAVAAVCGV